MAQKQPDITRDKILQAAFYEVHRQGFQAASLNTILARSGLTKGALYHHFQTKDQLGHALIDEVICPDMDARLFAPLRSAADPLQALCEVLRQKAKAANRETVSLGCPLNNLMQEMSPLDLTFQQKLNGVLVLWQNTMAEALRRGQQQGQVRKTVDCRAAALFIVSAWEGCVGIAKNLQSVKEFRSCLVELEAYVQSLAAARSLR